MRAEAAAVDQRTATGRETVGSVAARWPVDYPRPRERLERSAGMHVGGNALRVRRGC
jgi:hypothetical protein